MVAPFRLEVMAYQAVFALPFHLLRVYAPVGRHRSGVGEGSCEVAPHRHEEEEGDQDEDQANVVLAEEAFVAEEEVDQEEGCDSPYEAGVFAGELGAGPAPSHFFLYFIQFIHQYYTRVGTNSQISEVS